MSLPPPLALALAQQKLLHGVLPLGAVALPTDQCNGRYLAQDLIAHRTQPAADLSAMDGYAVGAQDLSGPWTVAGESAAGHPYAGKLQNGEAIRISTGALMPQGGGAVLLQENAQRQGDQLSLNGEGDPAARHIRRKGFDFGHGDKLVPQGALLNPARLALAISAGIDQLEVARQPSVAILDSGDELASNCTALADHQIPASNGPMLAAMCIPFSHQITRLGPVGDRMEDVLAALDKAAAQDVIVTSGGASVGTHDLIRPALEKWGATIKFWRIAIKPGKPIMVATKNRQIILGLPGNPVSAYVTAFLFLLPLLRKLAGSAEPLPAAIKARLTKPMAPTGKRTEFVRGLLDHTGVTPNPGQDSSGLAALSQANALIERPGGSSALEIGDVANVYPLQNGGFA